MGPYISKFPGLKTFVITTSKLIMGERRDNLDTLVLQYFKKNPNLKCVDMLWEIPRLYKRWIEGIPQPQLVELSEDWIIDPEPRSHWGLGY